MTAPNKNAQVSSKIDWFQATIKDDPENLINNLCDAFSASVEFKNGRNGYKRTAVLSFDEENIEVYFDGNNGANPNLKASGSISGVIRSFVQGIYPDKHNVTRIDSAIDLYSSSFDDLYLRLHPIAEKNRVKEQVVGDWFTEGSPEGRTVYYGSPSSSARLRMYEKGKEQRNLFSRSKFGKVFVEQIPLDWVRFEAQIRPTKSQKPKAAISSSHELFGFASFIAEMYQEVIGESVNIVPILPKTPSDVDRAFSFMLHQYKRVLRQKAVQMGGYEELGVYISHQLEIIS